MSETARALLDTFDTLSPADQREVAGAILRRSASDEDGLEQELLLAADELFRSYDAEEASRGSS